MMAARLFWKVVLETTMLICKVTGGQCGRTGSQRLVVQEGVGVYHGCPGMCLSAAWSVKRCARGRLCREEARRSGNIEVARELDVGGRCLASRRFGV